MQIRNLFVFNFRNYRELRIEFSGSMFVFVGSNAQGKTNLLEAIYFLFTARSHRTSHTSELKTWDAEEFRVRGDVSVLEGSIEIDIRYQSGEGKRVYVDGQRLSRIDDLADQVNIVFFAPDDLKLVKGSPGQRRDFFDHEFSQLSSAYTRHLREYNKVLYQRNTLLKRVRQKRVKPGLLEVWNQQLVEHGSQVIHLRQNFIEQLKPLVSRIYSELTGEAEDIGLKYANSLGVGDGFGGGPDSCEDIRAVYRDLLATKMEKEVARGVTLYGPHRDDLNITFAGDRSMRKFGSQGQQRTVALALKLAELFFIKQIRDEYPVLLLDDVLSELDDTRKHCLMDMISGQVQTFLTTTEDEGIRGLVGGNAEVYLVRDGRVATRE